MASNDVDPVLRELIRSVDESDQSDVPVPLNVPVTLTVRGAVLAGSLIAELSYFDEVAQASPLMDALAPGSDQGDSPGRDPESGRYLHLRTANPASDDGAPDLWRVRLDAVDAWTLHALAEPPGQVEEPG